MPVFCLNTFTFSPFAGAKEPVDFGELLDGVAEAGFPALSLDAFTLAAYAEAGHTYGALARRMREAGLVCPEMLGFMVTEDDPASVLDGARTVADAVAAFGASYVLGMVTTPPDDRCLDLFAGCAEILAEAGAKAAVEFLPFSPVATVEQARALVRHAGTDRAGVVVDSWHVFNGPETLEGLAALPLEELAYVQVDDHPHALPADADLYTECMERRVMPGDGVFDLAGFRGVLDGIGFDGVVSVEVINPALAAAGPAAFARDAWAAVGRVWG
ncbi:sugar phosphate isomerase/epimerase family protein [Yinghuangia seranimata]|uniref:sugar phosphate isomerase/epimerase family protein n=1 Tax=Yinghuangia seranimata TaxID=408067 RepID=UPI00248C8C02|nr:sugar phosphate isomerase/epimerase family protein [Yinghuangia seranimata]MDI2129696.1 sugar phosphate isomerase/epimerase family protein [Yinghuangia seranimata]